jgi:DNA-binding Xre family transcriptional regulator
MNAYWQNVKSALDARGENWVWLAEQIGLSQSNLSKMYRFDKYPRADTHHQICKLLGVSGEFLFSGNDTHFDPTLLDIYVQLPLLGPQQADAVRALLSGFKNLTT